MPNTYSLRLQYAPDAFHLPLKDEELLPNWSRDFIVSGKHTLEQLNEIILDVLHWDEWHLYEFRIGSLVYAHMVFLDEDDLFVDAKDPCTSCDIPIQLLGLSIADTFVYMFDFGDYHTFQVTVLDIQSASQTRSIPALISWQGKNLIQYSGTMSEADVLAFETRPPTVLCKRFLRDARRATTLRGYVTERYRKLFESLDEYRRGIMLAGFASSGTRRRYWEGIRSSNIDKRNRAL